MTEPESTGYQDSPDTTDPAGAPATDGTDTTDATDAADATLTTDDDAQSDDGIVRPGNEAD
jgi:hypothetical protein